MVCYMLVDPNPLQSPTGLEKNGKRGFSVKFGDGEIRSAYPTHNDNFSGIENHNHPRQDKYVTKVERYDDDRLVSGWRSTGKAIEPVAIGKALEWTYLKWEDFSKDRREWHRIEESPEIRLTIEQLQQKLIKALQLFPNVQFDHNMIGDPNSLATEQFDAIMDEVGEHTV